jgi:Domain of unknown function (DUF4279)
LGRDYDRAPDCSVNVRAVQVRRSQKLGEIAGLVVLDMTWYTSPRRAYLAIESESMSPDQISEVLQVQPDEAVAKGTVPANSPTGRPARRTAWKLIEEGSASIGVSFLIEALYKRIFPFRDAMKRLNYEGCDIFLRVVLYHSVADEGSRGFALDPPLIKLLAEIGASIDVDQYLLTDDEEVLWRLR